MNWESVYGRPATDVEGFALETFHAALRGARKLLVWPGIPPEPLAEARRSYLTDTEGEWLIALTDPAALGQGAHLGFAVTTQALYWRNIGQDPGRASFDGMPEPELRGTWLQLGEAGAIDVQAVDASSIEALQRWSSQLAAAYRDGVPWDHVRGWHVRHKADARGPYTWREMEALLRSGALLPYTSEARGPGLPEWTPMARIDEVAKILAEQKAQAKPPEPQNDASRRITARPQADAPVTVARPARPPAAKAPAKKQDKTVGQMIDGLIESVLKRFRP